MRLPAFFRSTRFWGLLGVALAGYLLFFVVLGRTDVSWMLPSKKIAQTLRETWPDLPFFNVQKEPTRSGTETFYTVPTRQLTPEEIARLSGTNREARPVAP